MKFTYDQEEIVKSTLVHKKIDGNRKELITAKRLILKNNPNIENINNVMETYNRTFFNHYVETFRFISTFLYIGSNRDNLCRYLFIYMDQFYKEFLKINNITDIDNMLDFNYKSFSRFINILEEWKYEEVQKNIEFINNTLLLCSIIEDFLVRFYNYSIIGVSNQKYIITACSDCDKRFIDQLMNGYSLVRLRKVRLIEGENPHYEFMDVLPTKDVGFPIEEFIEITSNNKGKTRKLVRVS